MKLIFVGVIALCLTACGGDGREGSSGSASPPVGSSTGGTGISSGSGGTSATATTATTANTTTTTTTTATATAADSTTSTGSRKDVHVSVRTTGSGSVSVVSSNLKAGDATSARIDPADGHEIASALGCGGRLVGTSYVIEQVSRSCVIEIAFAPLWENAGSEVKVELQETGAPLATPEITQAYPNAGQVSIVWAPVEGADEYWLFYDTAEFTIDHHYAEIVRGISDTEYLVAGLDEHVTHAFAVIAVNGNQKSALSDRYWARPTDVNDPNQIRAEPADGTKVVDGNSEYDSIVLALAAVEAADAGIVELPIEDAQRLEVGTIYVSGFFDDSAPFVFTKVISKSNNGSAVEVQYETPSLLEAFETLYIGFDTSQENSSSSAIARKITNAPLQTQTAASKCSGDLDIVELEFPAQIADEISGCFGSQFHFSGYLEKDEHLNIIDFRARIDMRTEAFVEFSPGQKSNLGPSIPVKKIGSKELSPGLKLDLDVTATVNFEVETAGESSLRIENNGFVELIHDAMGWRFDSEFDVDPTFVPPPLQLGTVSFGIGPRLRFTMFGVGGPTVSLRAGASSDGLILDDRVEFEAILKVTAGVGASSVQLPLLGFGLQTRLYSKPLFEKPIFFTSWDYADSLTGNWTGTLAWKCRRSSQTSTEVTAVLVEDEKGNIDGTVTYLGETLTLTGSKRGNTPAFNDSGTIATMQRAAFGTHFLLRHNAQGTLINNDFSGSVVSPDYLKGQSLNGPALPDVGVDSCGLSEPPDPEDWYFELHRLQPEGD